MKATKLCFNLFLDFARISSVTLGGGAVMLPLMEESFVKKRKWLSESEMLEIFSIVQTLPGIIATNAAVLIGKKVAGAKGAAAAVAGVVIPPTLIMMIFAGVVASIKDYPPVEAALTGVRAGAAALILVVLARISKKTFKNIRDIIIAISAFLLLRVFGVNAVLIVLLSAAIGLLLSFLPVKEEKTNDPT